MKGKLLHPTQEKLLEILIETNDEPLTIRELQDKCGLSSTSMVAHHMLQLEKKGYLKRNPMNPRDYQIIKNGPESPVAYLNLYGLASCGPNGSILDGNPIERIPISSRLLSFPSYEAFMVKAKGKSMEPKIQDGDYVIVRKISKLDNGKVYVCVNSGEAIIKRVLLDDGRIILHSFNSDFKPFLAAEDFRIEGEVKSIISNKI